MKRIGVTGGIGSGKTTVCRMLEELGARVFYADEEGKRLLVDDPAARREVIELFGEQAYREDGSLNRKYLAGQVFEDEAKLERLNAIVHPRVFDRFEEAARQAEVEDAPLMVKEAALIFETGGEKYLDAVVVVDAPEELRIDRVRSRDGVDRSAVTSRMRHQMDPQELRRRADVVIENDGGVKDLREKVERLFDRFADR